MDRNTSYEAKWCYIFYSRQRNPAFRELLLTLITIMSNLHRQGVGATKNSAAIISTEHEMLFWKKGLFGYDNPKSLQRAVFFCIGQHFVLHRVDEQHNLMLDQVVRNPSSTEVYSGDVYYESFPKTTYIASKILIPAITWFHLGGARGGRHLPPLWNWVASKNLTVNLDLFNLNFYSSTLSVPYIFKVTVWQFVWGLNSHFS